MCTNAHLAEYCCCATFVTMTEGGVADPGFNGSPEMLVEFASNVIDVKSNLLEYYNHLPTQC